MAGPACELPDGAGDTLETAVAGLAGFINAKPDCGVTAVADGARHYV